MPRVPPTSSRPVASDQEPHEPIGTVIQDIAAHRKNACTGFALIKKEVSEFHPPSNITKKQRVLEFCKGLLGIALVAGTVAGIICAIVFGAPVVIPGGASLSTILGVALPLVGASGLTLGALTGKITSFIIWELKKMKAAFSKGSPPSSITVRTDVERILHAFLENLEKRKKRLEKDSIEPKAMFNKKDYACLIGILQDNASLLKIKVKFKTTEAAFLKKLHEANNFSQLEDEITFKADETTPKTAKQLLRYLDPTEAQRAADKRIAGKFKNMLQFLDETTRAEEREAELPLIDPSLVNFDNPALNETEKKMSITGIQNLARDLTEALGVATRVEVSPPSPRYPEGKIAFDEIRLPTEELTAHYQGVNVTADLIKQIIKNHFAEIDAKKITNLTEEMTPNAALYKQWYEEVQKEQSAARPGMRTRHHGG